MRLSVLDVFVTKSETFAAMPYRPEAVVGWGAILQRKLPHDDVCNQAKPVAEPHLPSSTSRQGTSMFLLSRVAGFLKQYS